MGGVHQRRGGAKRGERAGGHGVQCGNAPESTDNTTRTHPAGQGVDEEERAAAAFGALYDYVGR